jgi:hypothetical protein
MKEIEELLKVAADLEEQAERDEQAFEEEKEVIDKATRELSEIARRARAATEAG